MIRPSGRNQARASYQHRRHARSGFLNCANGIAAVNSGEPYCPILPPRHKRINYVAANTSRPSDSFPGLTAIVTGGSPALTGVYYDVAYARNLDAPQPPLATALPPAPALQTPHRPAPLPSTKKALTSIKPRSMAALPARHSPMAASTQLIPPNCPATPAAVALQSFPGSSSAPTASSASSTRLADTPHGLTNILPTPPSPVALAPAPSTTSTLRKSIRT